MADSIKVLLVWQGAAGMEVAKRLKIEFPGVWAQREQRRADPESRTVTFHTIADDPSLDEAIPERIEHGIRDCDCVIAVHAPDPKPASESRGNLWFELGLWFARRGGFRHVLLLQIEDPDGTGTPACGVSLPSDLRHLFAQPVAPGPASVNDEVEAFIQRQLNSRGGAAAAPQYQPMDKVRDVFGLPTYEWVQARAEECASLHRRPCKCASSSLIVIAELLRMGSSSWELAQLGNLLYQVTLETRALQYANYASPRKAAMEALRRSLKVLAELERQLRRRDEELAPWKRLIDFLAWRIELFPPQDDADSVKTSLSRFHEHVTLITDTDIFEDPYFAGQSNHRLRQKIDAMASDCEQLARYVRYLHTSWIQLCRTHLKREIAGWVLPSTPDLPSALNEMSDTLERVASALPHNRLTDWKIRIWPTLDSQHGHA